ncbi:hypothetical protein HHI36_021923 [Cryptolaemus montrouzieri]|uniref:Uncharacterized protein n=1 Tax=Cryptolaemus montrouzieri TaxID=559131 RepID=A0ABD2MZ76_9CUCU
MISLTTKMSGSGLSTKMLEFKVPVRLITLCFTSTLYPQDTSATTGNSEGTSPTRNKRSFGFSNPIFSRVFNPYDDRPLAAKFFGDDYAPSVSRWTDDHQYYSDPWNYDTRWNYDEDSEEEEEEDETPIRTYNTNVNRPYPSHHIIGAIPINGHSNVENTETKKENIKGDYIFKSLPHFDSKRPFRTSEEVKKKHDVISINPAVNKEKKNVTITLPTNKEGLQKEKLEYIFNLLPHYKVHQSFRTSISKPINTVERFSSKETSPTDCPPTIDQDELNLRQQLKIQEIIEKDKLKPKKTKEEIEWIHRRKEELKRNYLIERFGPDESKWPPNPFKPFFDLQIQSSDIVTQKSVQPIQTTSNPRIVYSYGFNELPHFDIRFGFKNSFSNSITKLETETQKPNKLFDEKEKGIEIIEKSSTPRTELSFVLPNYEKRTKFEAVAKEVIAYTPKPSAVSEVKASHAPKQNQSFILPSQEIIQKFQKYKAEAAQNFREESVLTKGSNKSEFLNTKSNGIISQQKQFTKAYIPHRTKINDKVSSFFSIPSYTIYQPFKSNIHLKGKLSSTTSSTNIPIENSEIKPFRDVPVSQNTTAKPRSDSASDQLPKDLNTFKPSTQSSTQSDLSQPIPKHHTTIFETKLKPKTQPTSLFNFKYQNVVASSETPVSLASSTEPITPHQSFKLFETPNRNIIQTFSAITSTTQRYPSFYFSSETPSTSEISNNYFQEAIEKDSHTSINVNIPQTILDNLNKHSETPRLKYITQSVIIRPIEQKFPLRVASTTNDADYTSKPSSTSVKPFISHVTPATSIKPEEFVFQMTEHQIRRKPSITWLANVNQTVASTPVTTTTIAPVNYTQRPQRRRPLPPNTYGAPQKVYLRKIIKNANHKLVRKDKKKLPLESNVNFNELPHFQENSFFIKGKSDNVTFSHIGEVPLENHKIWDTNKRNLMDSYGRPTQE